MTATNVSKVTLNDINLAAQDLATNGGYTKFDKDSYNSLCALNLRVNAELFETHRLLGCRYDELDGVTNALDSVTAGDADDEAAIEFYTSRKARLVDLTNELSDKLEEIKDNMKTQYVELTEEEFEVFASAVAFNSQNGQDRTGFSK